MQILRSLVSKEVLDVCNREIDSYLMQRLWSLSNTTWGSSLHEGITGTCMAASPSNLTCIKIRAAILKHLPDSKELNLNYHYWNKHWRLHKAFVIPEKILYRKDKLLQVEVYY